MTTPNVGSSVAVAGLSTTMRQAASRGAFRGQRVLSKSTFVPPVTCLPLLADSEDWLQEFEPNHVISALESVRQMFLIDVSC